MKRTIFITIGGFTRLYFIYIPLKLSSTQVKSKWNSYLNYYSVRACISRSVYIFQCNLIIIKACNVTTYINHNNICFNKMTCFVLKNKLVILIAWLQSCCLLFFIYSLSLYFFSVFSSFFFLVGIDHRLIYYFSATFIDSN